MLAAFVDAQRNRLEREVNGFGAGEESWLIAYGAIPADPARDPVWLGLDRQVMNQTFEHQGGQKTRTECMTLESGGHHAEMVYRYCKARVRRNVFAIKGATTSGQPLLGRPTISNPYRARLYMLCVDAGKETVYARLRIGTPGPGFMHMPDWIDREYVDQLTAEKALRKYLKNRGSVRIWVKTRDRNEALDLEVYALVALYILGQAFVKGLGARAARLARRIAGRDEKPAAAAHRGLSRLRQHLLTP